MFTGIIEGLGEVKRLTKKGEDAFLEIEAAIDFADVCSGDSIAVNGVCLTVTAKTEKGFQADVSAETLTKSTIKHWQAGMKVNLEKSLKAGGYIGGHFVLGHVDAACMILSRKQKSGSIIFAVEADGRLARYITEKGSIAVDGISLTVNALETGRFYVNIIPHTAAQTTLVAKKEGDWVNIETDILGKYVEKLLQTSAGIDKEFLIRHGFAHK